ncbi:DEAD/DEAH box helicase family protein [soil metagenome]
MKTTLNDTLDAALKFGGPEFYKGRVPLCIYSNLKDGYGERPYQQEAFGRFVFYWNEYHDRPKGVPTQLLYHMATGSGKTLIMAGLIIYLYERGYRNFLFFVNSTNIIDKTRDNFFNTTSSKYLFSETVSIGGKQIKIKEVENFQAANQDDINIVFSTIQGLHSKLNTPKENSLTYDDFEENKIVLISDEAHHINAETKKGGELGLEEKEEIISWEGTVNRIFNANRDNVLLEFTATADLSVPEIEKKYSDKLIFDYPLKQFRKDGYSKEVKVLQADLSPFDRALQAVLLSQYRRKVFEKYKKLIKPVILFKSKTIKESQTFFEEFANGIKNLKISHFEKIKNSKPDEAIEKVFRYLEENNISLENLITEFKEDFSEAKLISVNSKDESEQKQIAVNSLEDESNEYRAVFAVDKLNEGWDVLNLFDIVRLYDTRDAKDGKPGKTTMAEAQLIGRGARYCPFQITAEQPYFGRKFDADIGNEMRVCEELYYHSAYNPRYIQELNTALEEIGIKAKQTIERPIKLKKEFKETTFYKAGLLFLNEQRKYNRGDVFSLKSTLIDQTHKVNLKTGYTKSSIAFSNSETASVDRKEKEYKLSDFGENVIRKAINKLEFYQFSNLKSLLPNLNSVTEFITSDDYLGKIKLDITGLSEQIENLSSRDKLEASIKVLQDISVVLASDKINFKGSKEFKPYLIKDRINDKVLNFTLNESEDKEYGRSMSNPAETGYHLDLSKRDWYVFDDCFGTSEEKLLIKYIDKVYEKMKPKYEEVYLVRNERHFKIYNFDDGRPTEPDFVLFLVNHHPEETLHYQIFIEPKGQHLLKQDEWKERFIQSLREEHQLEQLWKGRKYVVWGMPFYNEALRKNEFENAFKHLMEEN